MALDLLSCYDSPPFAGKLASVTVWKRKPDAPKYLPPRVAVKEVRRQRSFQSEEGALLADGNETVLLSLKHANIVEIYQARKNPFNLSLSIIMEACAGSLVDHLKRNTSTVYDLRSMGPQLLAGLDYIHGRGITHRDVKPSNILVNSLGRRAGLVLKLGNFGSSKHMGVWYETALVCGSLDYMAPELLRAYRSGEPSACYVGEKVDIFSAGLTFYKIAKREIPFALRHARLRDDFDHAAFLRASVIGSDECVSLLSQMLSWKAEERRSAADLLRHAFFSRSLRNAFGNRREEGPLRHTEHIGFYGYVRRLLAPYSDTGVSSPENQWLATSYKTETSPRKFVEPETKLKRDRDREGPPLRAYTMETQLGRGSLGDVSLYKVRERLLYQTYPPRMAVKRIMKNEICSIRELDISLVLQHENIVRIYGVEEGMDLVYLKMEPARCDLNLLKDHLVRKRLIPSEVGHLAHHIVSGLCYLHSSCIVHRDIKPGNILAFWDTSVSPYQDPPITLKLCDFGMSRIISHGSDTTVVGTKSYMAPEVVRAMKDGQVFRGDYRKADVFSTGVVIYELWQDRKPFLGADPFSVEGTPLAFRELSRGTEEKAESQVLKRALRGMLELSSEERLEASEARIKLPSRRLMPKLKDTFVKQESFEADQNANTPCRRLDASYDLEHIKLSRYERHETIGSGSSAQVSVYRLKSSLSNWLRRMAFNQPIHLPAKIAVKVTFMEASDKWALREVRIAKMLSHENVVRFYGIEERGQMCYIKMELANTDLSRLQTRLQIVQFSPSEVIFLATQIASGISYLHRNSITHRDIKPSNILALWDDSVRNPGTGTIVLKICDFALSKFSPDDSMTQSAVGTKRYMSPEVGRSFYNCAQFCGSYWKADVFSAGVVIYELVFGKLPFTFDEICKGDENEMLVPRHDNAHKDITGILREMLRWNARERCDARTAKQMLLNVKSVQGK